MLLCMLKATFLQYKSFSKSTQIYASFPHGLYACVLRQSAGSRWFSVDRFGPWWCGHGLFSDSSIPECAVSAMHKYELDQFRLNTNMKVPGHFLYKCDMDQLKLNMYSKKRRTVLRTYRWIKEVRGIECQKLETSNGRRWCVTSILLCQLPCQYWKS